MNHSKIFITVDAERVSDALVRFVEDFLEEANGPTYIRYNGALLTWEEFLRACEAEGLTAEFAEAYAWALPTEIIYQHTSESGGKPNGE